MVGLSPEQIRELVERFGSPHVAAINALQNPRFAETLQPLAHLFERRDGSLDFAIHPAMTHAGHAQREALFWRIVYASHLATATPKPAGERSADEPKPRHRPPDPLPRSKLERCVTEIKKRQAAGGRRAPHDLTLEQIGLRVHLPPSRVRQIETLMTIGWDPLRSDPDFLTDDEETRLPTVPKARSLLGLNEIERNPGSRSKSRRST